MKNRKRRAWIKWLKRKINNGNKSITRVYIWGQEEQENAREGDERGEEGQ